MAKRTLLHEEITRSVIGAFFDVYNELGYGFLEHIYVKALEYELRARRHNVGREVWIRVVYKGEELGIQRMDLVVDEKVIVELKASLDLPKGARQQLHNYLRATSLEVGLLFHFGPQPRFYRIICPNEPFRHANKKVVPIGSA